MCNRPSSLRLLLHSVGDLVGPAVESRAMEASSQDISSFKDKRTFSLAWACMESLQPTNVLVVGDDLQ
jgi:hypothetical protein